MDGELLLHLDVVDAIREHRDDGLAGLLGDLDPCTVEALNVLLQGLSWWLLDAAQVARDWWAVTSALEVGDEAVVHLVLGGDRAVLQVQEPEARSILECHGKPVRHDLFVAVGHFDAQLIELQELRGVGGAVVARRQIRLELAWPGDATQLGVKARQPAVVAGAHFGGGAWS